MTDPYQPATPRPDPESDSPRRGHEEPPPDDSTTFRVGGILAVWFAIITGFYFGILDPTRWGPAGDAVAPVTALLTVLTLGAAVCATNLQRLDLKKQAEAVEIQREELKLQRHEMKEATGVQREIAERQEKLAAAQQALVSAQLRAARALEMQVETAALREAWAFLDDFCGDIGGLHASYEDRINHVCKKIGVRARASGTDNKLVPHFNTFEEVLRKANVAETTKMIERWTFRMPIETEDERRSRLEQTSIFLRLRDELPAAWKRFESETMKTLKPT